MRGAAYARYSTDHQQHNSIEYQLEAIRRYCAENYLLFRRLLACSFAVAHRQLSGE